MAKLTGIANTAFVPLLARVSVSKRFPDYFFDEKALELEPLLPADARRGASQYTDLASVARYRHADELAGAFIDQHGACNLVYLGVGLDTASFRLASRPDWGKVACYAVDLPDVIDLRRRVLGPAPETPIGEDMFTLGWADPVDPTRPTLVLALGVFQYFPADTIVAFCRALGARFPGGELVFDATSRSGLWYANWFIRRTGNASAQMHFCVDDGAEFAERTGALLVAERLFFPESRALLGRRLNPLTRVSMAVADWLRQLIVLHLRWPA